jgi:hypothetical protein
MPPEIIRSKFLHKSALYSIKTDAYSLGMSIFRALYPVDYDSYCDYRDSKIQAYHYFNELFEIFIYVERSSKNLLIKSCNNLYKRYQINDEKLLNALIAVSKMVYPNYKMRAEPKEVLESEFSEELKILNNYQSLKIRI